MDAHLFRRFCDAILPWLAGARMEKIHAPADDVLCFSLFCGRGEDRRRCLILRHGRQHPFIFTAPRHVPVNAQPPAYVMRLRKHLSGKHVENAVCEWTERRLWLGFSCGATWLKLDLREGASLSFDPPIPFADPPWPDPAVLQDPPDRWREWAVLTPALRRQLAAMDPADAAALLVDLSMGGGDVFLYENRDGCTVSAWPMPALAEEGWRETVFSDPAAAMEKAGEQIVFRDLAQRSRQNAAKPFLAESARLGRLLKKLDDEERRLTSMREKQKSALLLQSQLYLFDKAAHLGSVTLHGTEGDIVLPLDEKRTLGENMADLFHQAGRGKRGLEHLARRRDAVLKEKMRAEQAVLGMSASVSGAAPKGAPAAVRTRDFPAGMPPQVQAFRSSDGFLMLRGRSAKGNALALKMAAPHDYWLHTAEGPSAHVIIRRDHAAHDVPPATLREAGILTALKSWQKDQRRALIQYSLAKHIHPMKNAPAGTVRIDGSEGSFAVDIDPDLENTLEKS
ncbi:MAG: DUF814 domain-containing protein [Mailhella sp.]|nr:DUF814 domain-containing protein [Mailhella sp.]